MVVIELAKMAFAELRLKPVFEAQFAYSYFLRILLSAHESSNFYLCMKLLYGGQSQGLSLNAAPIFARHLSLKMCSYLLHSNALFYGSDVS